MFGDGFRSIDGEADCDENNSARASAALREPEPKTFPSHHVGGLNDGVVGFYTAAPPAPNACPTNSDGSPATTTRAPRSPYRTCASTSATTGIRASAPSSGRAAGSAATIDVRFDAWDNSGIARAAVRGCRPLADDSRGCDFRQ